MTGPKVQPRHGAGGRVVAQKHKASERCGVTEKGRGQKELAVLVSSIIRKAIICENLDLIALSMEEIEARVDFMRWIARIRTASGDPFGNSPRLDPAVILEDARAIRAEYEIVAGQKSVS